MCVIPLLGTGLPGEIPAAQVLRRAAAAVGALPEFCPASQASDFGGGSGTSSPLEGKRGGARSGHSLCSDCPTKYPVSGMIRMTFSTAGAVSEGHWFLVASLAAFTAKHKLQGFAGSNVSLAADTNDSVPEYPVNILAHATAWATSSMAPLAQSHAQSREIEARRRRMLLHAPAGSLLRKPKGAESTGISCHKPCFRGENPVPKLDKALRRGQGFWTAALPTPQTVDPAGTRHRASPTTAFESPWTNEH
jgi:hypothetical protein